jgi:hypothetical protein
VEVKQIINNASHLEQWLRTNSTVLNLSTFINPINLGLQPLNIDNPTKVLIALIENTHHVAANYDAYLDRVRM